MPWRTVRLTSSSATKSPNLRCTPWTMIAFSAGLIVAPPAHCGSARQVGSLHSPPGRENPSPSFAGSFFHRHEGGHAGAQVVAAFDDADARGEHLIGALVGGLQVARRIFADGVDVLDHALELP